MKYLVSFVYLLPISVLANTAMQDLTALNIDELMQIEVTSVSKKSEKLSQAAAAVYVVTRNEINRSGATSIPEALRLVPGVDVAQIDPNKWAIGMRGFNGRLANKLLVMIDGRSVYTPTYSGVYWENLDYLMTDIERIEVIRGPGATLWGTNAVNGVINIITREASETIGGTFNVATGNELNGLVGIRQGGELSKNTQLRVYAKGKSLDKGQHISGREQNNGGNYLSTGFRLDWQGENGQSSSFQGALFQNRLQQEHSAADYQPPHGEKRLEGDVDIDGGNLSAQWNKHIGLESEITANLRYDYYDRKELKYDDRRDTIDVEIQHQFSPIKDHEFIWGAGYRYSRNKLTDGQLGSVEEANQDMDIWNLYVQDKIYFPEHNAAVTLGTKFEGNNYSDMEVQPNIRASWFPNNDFTLWSAISRAKRIPSRGETDIRFDLLTFAPGYPELNNPLPVLVSIQGSEDYDAEKVDAYELGIRWMPTDKLAWDLAYFYNDYENLRSYVPGTMSIETFEGQPFIVLPFILENNIHGYTQGIELLGTWQATNNSRYRFTYSFIDSRFEDAEPNSYSEDMITLIEDRAPLHQASIWGSYDITPEFWLDIRVFYVDERPWTVNQPGGVGERYNADVRFAWQANDSLELSLMGRNILEDAQQEFITELWPSSSAIERSYFLKAEVMW